MQRLQYDKAAPQLYKAMADMYSVIRESGLDHKLVGLVYLRISQINGCAFCIDMHSQELITVGETQQRMLLLPAWRETSLYSERERAALAWAESVTLVSETHVPDELYEEVRQHFSETELATLTMAIALMNGFNRLGVAFRKTPPNRKTVAAAQA